MSCDFSIATPFRYAREALLVALRMLEFPPAVCAVMYRTCRCCAPPRVTAARQATQAIWQRTRLRGIHIVRDRVRIAS